MPGKVATSLICSKKLRVHLAHQHLAAREDRWHAHRALRRDPPRGFGLGRQRR
jgi:hypothetical protein